MARNKSKLQALLFEELEPRLLFSADIAEPVAAEVVQEEVQQEPVIIIADAPEQIDAPADTVSENPANTPSSADTQEETQSSEDTAESIDAAPVSDTETIPSESETGASENPDTDTNQNTPETVTGEDTATSSLLNTETPSTILLDDTAAQRNELVLINDNVRDIDELVSGIELPDNSTSTIEVVVLDTEQNGIEQVSDILANYENLDAIHIFTHGRDGSLALGIDWLDTSDLLQNSDAVKAWGDALNENGDILLYGCSIAAGDAGQDFVDSLSELTKADVTASDDPTGHDDLGGDWELEYSSGTIDTSIPLASNTQHSWNQIMAATIEDDFNTGTYGGSTGSVPWNIDWQEIGESDGAAFGNVVVYTSSQFGNAQGIDLWKKPGGIWREANLSGATTATLSFDWGMLYTDDFDTVTLEISTDGGTNWNLIDTYTGPLTHSSLQAASYNISSFIDNDTRIKFETTNFSDNDEFFFDNIVIDFNVNVITVDTEADILDGNTNSILELIADPGTDGNISLREAIEAANNTTGFDKISFNIPGAGPHVITLDQNLNALPYITEAIYIDGSSEPDYAGTPVIQIDGSDLSAKVGDNYDGFRLDTGSDGSTIRGFSITGFTDGGNWGQALDIRSDNNVIAGNYLGLAPDG
ncbi:MAG: DUF4347 domain-containing protein, partial [Deltaproteobacteria bacterium]|nr:DUF4347 domain-containing protein [Deltaproteobacteria bacterium]